MTKSRKKLTKAAEKEDNRELVIVVDYFGGGRLQSLSFPL